MASCDVQATLTNNKMENITECPSKVAAPSKITDTSSAIASAITQIEAKTETVNDVIMNVNLNDNNVESVGNKIGQMLQPTKIPAPIHMGNGFHNRKYTTLMTMLDSKKQRDDTFSSTSTLVNTTVDSGIQMDTSTAEDDLHSLRPGSLTPRQYNSTETMVSSDSMMELEAAEQQTLRVLQRAVAEMEADVAMHSAKLEQEIKLDVDRQLKLAMEEQQQEQDKDQKVDQTEFKDMFYAAVEIPENFPIGTATGTGAVERKLVRVEELLDAEHDMEMLHKLLQKDNQLVDAPDLSQSGDNLSEVNAPREDDESEGPRKPVGLIYSLLHLICGKGIRRLSYPILFCGMAVGLLFYFRKE